MHAAASPPDVRQGYALPSAFEKIGAMPPYARGRFSLAETGMAHVG